MLTTSKMHQKYAPIWGSVGLTLLIWILSKWYYHDWFENIYKYPAKAASLSATVMMCWVIVLSARFKFIEHYFLGLDKVYQVHKHIGRWSFYVILLHPFFLAFIKLPHIGEFLRYIAFRIPYGDRVLWGENLGILTFVILVILIACTLCIKLPYHIWKKTHEYMGFMLAAAILHVTVINGDIAAYPILKFWMYTIMLAALICFVYIRFLYRFIGPRYEYTISNKDHIGDILHLTFAPKNRVMDFKPSQFVYLVVNKKGISKEPHPYSIACGYNLKGSFKLGIKASGDYTRTLSAVEKGDAVTVYGPYGMFSDRFLSAKRDCIFIGGGIGITPFLGMWHVALHSEEQLSNKHLAERLKILHPEIIKTWKSPKVSLFYVVRSIDEASFNQDIQEEIASSHASGFGHHRERGHQYELYSADEKGLITAKYIEKQINGGLGNKDIYLCGPWPMMESLIKRFKEIGVHEEQFIVEDFNLV